METERVSPAAKTVKNVPLSIEDLKTARTQVFCHGLDVEETQDGASIKGMQGTLKDQVLVYAFLVRCRDQRVKITFNRPNNAFSEAVVISKEFDKDRAFAAALRIVLGDGDPRFRNKDRVEAFVKSVGVTEVAKWLPPVFSNFMFAVLHAFNCKTGTDVTDQINKLREQIQGLVPHLSEADVLRLYREAVVDWVGKL
jgi:enoyl reductase-like protein